MLFRSVAALKARFASQAGEIDRVLASSGVSAPGMVYVPMVGRKTFWTVFLDPATGEIKAYMPLDSF